MKTKKFMSLILALVMAFSLAVPAFATATPTLDNTDLSDMSKINSATTTVNGTYQAPVLALTVPKKINLLLNPYGVSVTTNKDTAIEQQNVQRQIVSADNLIISRSNVPIDIKATATATIASAEGGAWTLAQTTPAADSVKKEAYVYMVFGTVTPATPINSANAVTDFMLTAPANGKKPYQGLAFSDIGYPQTPNLTAPSAATDKRDGIILKAGEGKETALNQSLAECTVTEAVNNGATTYSYESVSAVAFKLDGAMVANPKDSSWGKDDKLTVSVAWKFVPGTQATSSGSGGVAPSRTEVTGTVSGSDITFSITAPGDVGGTPNYTATNVTFSGTTGTIAQSNFTGYSTATSGAEVTMDIDVTYTKSDSTTGTLNYTVKVTKT
ncbi:MAG: hypothetical protein IJR54_07480 [Oscillibacter sp.]|nr:hypothetical protein [Oscillibacter sp.]